MGDLYSVARSYDLALRLDAEALAVKNLASIAQKAAQKNKATYRMSVSEFNLAQNFRRRLDISSDMGKVAAAVDGLEPPLYWSDNCVTEDNCSFPGDRATASTDAMTRMAQYMQAPGSGIDDSKPQTILIIITDGMRDEVRASGASFPDYGFEPAICDAIKRRGIRIGILYTVYSEESLRDGGFSELYVLPNLPLIEPAIRKCATDGLFIPVETGGDITAALEELFNATISSARLLH